MKLKEIWEGIKGFWWYISEGQHPEDLFSDIDSSIFQGKVISDGGNICQIVTYGLAEGKIEKIISIRFLALEWSQLISCIGTKKDYILDCKLETPERVIYKIAPGQMLNDHFEVRLQWNKHSNWFWTIDVNHGQQ